MQLSLALVGLAHLFALSTAAAVPQSATGNGATVFCLAVCEPPGKICADGKPANFPDGGSDCGTCCRP